MYKKGKHRKFNMFDDIFARITIIQVSIAPRNRKQLYTCRAGCCCSRSHRTTISINKRQTFTKWFNCYASQCDITSFICEELHTVNNYLHNCRFLNECFESTTHFNHILCTARLIQLRTRHIAPFQYRVIIVYVTDYTQRPQQVIGLGHQTQVFIQMPLIFMTGDVIWTCKQIISDESWLFGHVCLLLSRKVFGITSCWDRDFTV